MSNWTTRTKYQNRIEKTYFSVLGVVEFKERIGDHERLPAKSATILRNKRGPGGGMASLFH